MKKRPKSFTKDMSTIDMFLKDGVQFVKMLDDSPRIVKNSFGPVKLYSGEIGMHVVGYEGKELTGMSLIRAIKDPVDKNIAIIKVEYVTLPKFRRQGRASKLAKIGVKCMAQWGLQAGKPFDLIEADIEPDNEVSIKVAEGLGLHLSRNYECDGKYFLVYADVIEYTGDDIG